MTGAAAGEYDVAVVGGGVNGAGIARDLAGRGARVLLVEKDDLASHTSSASTKLVHGGLRYLEYREFGLVRKALAEREVLLKSAPHIMWPLRFVMPHDGSAPGQRPAWMIRIGLFLYDHLARREVLAGSRGVDLRTHPAGAPLKPSFTKGFVYSDGWVDDARLVVLCALDAAERGATVLTRTACVDARRAGSGEGAHWRLRLREGDPAGEYGGEGGGEGEGDGQGGGGETGRGAMREVTARALVNAAGPWAARFLHEQAHATERVHLRLVKGSHIVVRKLFLHDHAYIFQNADGRIIFAIPYEGAYTLIGTTDVEHRGEIGAARAEPDEIAYLCAEASRYFAATVRPDDVVWTYSGVRPLLDDESGNPAAVTRDYRLELSDGGGTQAPLLSVWGGKITTFRKLAEEAADRLAPLLRAEVSREAWTETAFLPGGDLRGALGAAAPGENDVAGAYEAYAAHLAARHPSLDVALLRRWARAYGSRAERIAAAPGGLGREVAPQVFEAELAYLRDVEWARRGDDVLWRRSKLGLHLDEEGRASVRRWLVENRPRGGS